MKHGFVAFIMMATLLSSALVVVGVTRDSVNRANEYSRVLLSLQKLKAIKADTKMTIKQVFDSVEGQTIQERVFDVAVKLEWAEIHLEEKYRENDLNIGFGSCGPNELIDLSKKGVAWNKKTMPLVASILNWDTKIKLSNVGRSLLKECPLIIQPCFKGVAVVGNAKYEFDLNEFD